MIFYGTRAQGPASTRPPAGPPTGHRAATGPRDTGAQGARDTGPLSHTADTGPHRHRGHRGAHGPHRHKKRAAGMPRGPVRQCVKPCQRPDRNARRPKMIITVGLLHVTYPIGVCT